MNTKKLLLFMVACMLMVACVNENANDDTEKGAPTLSVDKNLISANKDAGRYNIAVRSNVEWTATVDDTSWCSISPKSSEGNNVIRITVAENTMAIVREAIITIHADTLQEKVTITQETSEATLSVAPTSIYPETNAAGTHSITVTSNAEWTAEVEYIVDPNWMFPDRTWCVLTPTSGSGNGVITVNLPQNPNSRRSAIITIKAGDLVKTVTIIQHGVPLTEEGVTINGITWATRNVGNFGAFVDMLSDFGKYYQFNRNVAYSLIDNTITPGWNAEENTERSINWLFINDPSPEGWRIPTAGELDNLLSSGHRWVNAGESGFSCAGAWFGPNAQNAVANNPGQAVFLPALGILSNGNHHQAGKGCYWSSDDTGLYYSPGGQSLIFDGTQFLNASNHFFAKEYGLLIRCVKE